MQYTFDRGFIELADRRRYGFFRLIYLAGFDELLRLPDICLAAGPDILVPQCPPCVSPYLSNR
jgi:hypothetical protein